MAMQYVTSPLSQRESGLDPSPIPAGLRYPRSGRSCNESENPSVLPTLDGKGVEALAFPEGFRRMLRLSAGAMGIAALSMPGSSALDLEVGIRLDLPMSEVVLSIPPAPGMYFTVQSSDLVYGFEPVAMNLGWEPVDWRIPLMPPSPVMTFRFVSNSVYAPMDTDGDGMDDIWELENGLDPLDASDAHQFSDASGVTNLQRYRLTGRDVFIQDSAGREMSVFNYQAPSAPFEAISREVSLFRGAHMPESDIQDVPGREVSIFNFGTSLTSVEAISGELSVYVGEILPQTEIEDIAGRELTVFNFGSNPGGNVGAEGREASVFNFGEPSAPLEGISREVSILNNIEL